MAAQTGASSSSCAPAADATSTTDKESICESKKSTEKLDFVPFTCDRLYLDIGSDGRHVLTDVCSPPLLMGRGFVMIREKAFGGHPIAFKRHHRAFERQHRELSNGNGELSNGSIELSHLAPESPFYTESGVHGIDL
jgi:hypothetical protein